MLRMQLMSSLEPETRCSTEYQKLVLSRVEECLSHGPQTLQNVFRACQGAYPAFVVSCLRELHNGAESVKLPGLSLNGAANIEQEISVLDSLEGNPVLCSWYFTAATCRRIEQLRDWSKLRLAFLGTPRLYDWFSTHDLGNERLLLDLDEVVVDKLSPLTHQEDSVLRYDVAANLPTEYHGRFDYVFFDPPWYPNDYRLWLSRAHLLAPNGGVLFSLFPELTRPDAGNERQSVLDFVRRHASESTLISSFLDYEVPSYELAQLKACGLQSIQPWRVADLIVSKLTAASPIEFPPESSDCSSKWVEVDIGLIRFFVGPATGAPRQSRLLTAPSNGSRLLPSPSRREPSRKEANVLSSRGHGLITSCPEELLGLLRVLGHRYRDGISVSETLEGSDTDHDTKELLVEILAEV